MGQLLPAIGTVLGGPLGGALGGIAGGMIGGGAAQPAAQAEQSAAGSTANILNQLLANYMGQFGPAQAQTMNQLSGLTGSIPINDIVRTQLAQELMPVQMPPQILARAQYGIQGQTDQALQQAQQHLAARGITGPAAEALLNQIREQGTINQAGLGSDVGAWEAGQTLAGRQNAMNTSLGLLGMTGNYADIANQLAGIGMQGGLGLTGLFGQQAAQAAAPWQQMMQAGTQGLADYTAKNPNWFSNWWGGGQQQPQPSAGDWWGTPQDPKQTASTLPPMPSANYPAFWSGTAL